jgi:hypothetical protein
MEQPCKFLIGLSVEEYEVIEALTTDNFLTFPRLYVFGSTDKPKYISNEGFLYKESRLGIIGDNNQGGTNIYSPTIPIILYSLDGFIYISSAFSKLLSIKRNTIDPFQVTDLIPSIIN